MKLDKEPYTIRQGPQGGGVAMSKSLVCSVISTTIVSIFLLNLACSPKYLPAPKPPTSTAMSKVGFLVIDSAEGKEVYGDMAQQAKEEGFSVAGVEFYHAGLQDFRPLIDKYKNMGVDTIWVVGTAVDKETIRNDLRKLGFDLTVGFTAVGGTSAGKQPPFAEVTSPGKQPETPKPEGLRKISFKLPGDGIPNNNQQIGPFCCTGETVIVTRNDGNPVGYVYFYIWKGQAYNIGNNRSIASGIEILVSGLRDLSDLHSEQIKSSVYFAAEEMQIGNSRSTKAGELYYKVTITDVKLETSSNMTYFDMDSVAVKVDVSFTPF